MLTGFLTALCFAFADGVELLQKLHRVPCDRCYYFSGDYRLKCAVHPCRAMTPMAVGCPDFIATTPRGFSAGKRQGAGLV
ncbi:MAG: hypothetical protein NZ821_08675 [Gloeomargarita sp. SKYB31]|nr:hypothetical protein [Gloeomargarita sp. SKYB31]